MPSRNLKLQSAYTGSIEDGVREVFVQHGVSGYSGSNGVTVIFVV